MKKSIFIIAVLFTGLLLYGQETKLTNTLLWRISGNGLSRPSYLYGTMHLTDKRVFQLGDSVYNAMETCEGFAAELDMNRLGTQMMNQFLREEETKNANGPVKVKDAVSEETWDKYKKQLEKKFGKKADKITIDDLDDLESKLQLELFKKGDMPTFLDAWLSGQARKQGKWVGGIEDLEDQLEHTEDVEGKIQMALFDDDYYRGSLDWFIKIYTAQKLDSIDAIMYRAENGRKDYIMIKRNVKMARRMDSLSAIRTTFFAVGAAHLPGDSGVVTLLRSRGFTVTPVISSKKISPDKYTVKTVDVPWHQVPVTDSSYSLQMPGEAEGVELFESLGLEMKTYFDISFMKLYMTVGVEIPEERRKMGTDSLYNSFRNQYAVKGKVLKDKLVNVNGVSGREYRISTDEGEMKMQVFIPPTAERVIMNLIFGFSEKSLSDKETEKFFQSFVLNANSGQPVVLEKKWTRLDFPIQSFSVEMPLKPRETKDVLSDPGKTTYSWQVMDAKDQVFYGISVSAMNETMYNSSSDTAFFTSIKDRLKENITDSKVLDSTFLSVANYPGYRVVVEGNTEGEVLQTKMIAVARGGLAYTIFVVLTEGSSGAKNAERFLNSFKLLPYKYPLWQTVSSPDKSFSTTAPFLLKNSPSNEDEDEDEDVQLAERYIIYDSVAFVTSYIDKMILPAWFWYSTDTGFLRLRASQYSSWSDSITDYKLEQSGNQKAASFTVVKQGDHLVKKIKIVLNGNQLYEVFGYYAKQDLREGYDLFFDNFRLQRELPGWDRSKPRVPELVTALKNADRKTAAEAKLWWEALEFTGADIPALQELLLKIYPDFDSTYYSNLNKKILEKVELLDTNHTTVAYIKKNYSSIQPADEYVKGFILSYLSSIQTAESYDLLKECLTKYPLSIKKAPYFSYQLYDSLQLTGSLFPELMKLGGSEVFWDQVSNLSSYLLDSNVLSKNAIREYGKYFIETARRELGKEKDEIEEASYRYSDLIKLLGVIGTPEAIALLKRFSKFDAREIKFRTYIAQLESNQAADNRTALTLASTDEYRHDLYDELKRINQLKLFPVGYLSQKELGRSKLYEYASEDDAEPEAIQDLGEKTRLYKGKQQKFYLYKVSFSEEENSYYLGVAGPYSSNAKELVSSHDLTGIYWDKEFDKKELEELVEAYFKSFVEDIEEAEMPAPAAIKK